MQNNFLILLNVSNKPMMEILSVFLFFFFVILKKMSFIEVKYLASCESQAPKPGRSERLLTSTVSVSFQVSKLEYIVKWTLINSNRGSDML